MAFCAPVGFVCFLLAYRTRWYNRGGNNPDKARYFSTLTLVSLPVGLVLSIGFWAAVAYAIYLYFTKAPTALQDALKDIYNCRLC